MNQEKEIKLSSGYFALAGFVTLIAIAIITIVFRLFPITAIAAISAIIMIPGFFFINPNGSRVMTLFGDYKGTMKANGFFWANPFFTRKQISLRARNFDSDRVKVNDKLGNPVMISVILVWRVRNTFKAAFEVDNYENFVRVQTDAAVRKMAGSYPYDDWEDNDDYKITLRSGMEEVNKALEDELSERLEIAGIEVLEARIGYLAYAEEIASSMLKRQQATAIIAAREKIVEGAVGMVENALSQLSEKGIVEFDQDKKATMVSNLMVVLCSDKEVTPVINTGSLHQ
ncbi:SPFH domain-containing protein [Salibacteraceae bacterium]|jgi:regulator of protease activity HflC (stomatin/prohibitin superfamily)|nr:SPFH domain-containing protein [Salibacteraceae bacterium]